MDWGYDDRRSSVRPRCRDGREWKPLILYHLNSSPKRFGDLRRLVAGISEKVLIQQLRQLAAVCVLVRHDYQRVPPMVDYTMTPFGMTLVRALMPLCGWGNARRDQVEEIMLARSLEQEARAG
jgi:DNA-binding HxlR family transcriptional regulator